VRLLEFDKRLVGERTKLGGLSEESSWRVGEETVNEEPEASVTEKFVGFTTMDWMTALDPESFRV
jgi:hypothetical protein